MISLFGMGIDTILKGSNVIDIFSQSGHTNVDLNCPWNKSTIIELFLFLWASQLSAATTLSGLSLLSMAGT